MPSSSLPWSQMSSTTSVGRRVRIAASASVLVAASRVSYPSSLRTPQISARMSASSSTTRMSCAMGALPFDAFSFVSFGFIGFGDTRIAAHEQQRHARAATGTIIEAQLAAVVFHDLLDDRQTETRAAGARGDVRLGQPIALLVRQADAV